MLFRGSAHLDCKLSARFIRTNDGRISIERSAGDLLRFPNRRIFHRCTNFPPIHRIRNEDARHDIRATRILDRNDLVEQATVRIFMLLSDLRTVIQIDFLSIRCTLNISEVGIGGSRERQCKDRNQSYGDDSFSYPCHIVPRLVWSMLP